MMDPITIAMGLAQFVPEIVKWFGASNNSVATAEKIVNIAKSVTSTSSGEEALKAVKIDPAISLKIQEEINRHTEELAKIGQAVDLAQIQAEQTVNLTMQTEAKADHWPTYSWRPFIGFIFGFMLLGDYFIIPILKGWWPAIPQPTIPPEAWVAIGAVLGVASYFRGKAQADPSVPTDTRG